MSILNYSYKITLPQCYVDSKKYIIVDILLSLFKERGI